MRNTDDSGKTSWTTSLSSCADEASRPNGFSTTTRAPSARPTRPRPWMTSGNIVGGMAR